MRRGYHRGSDSAVEGYQEETYRAGAEDGGMRGRIPWKPDGAIVKK